MVRPARAPPMTSWRATALSQLKSPASAARISSPASTFGVVDVVDDDDVGPADDGRVDLAPQPGVVARGDDRQARPEVLGAQDRLGGVRDGHDDRRALERRLDRIHGVDVDAGRLRHPRGERLALLGVRP